MKALFSILAILTTTLSLQHCSPSNKALQLEKEALELLAQDYISWTKTGDPKLGQAIFADQVDMTYELDNGTFEAYGFQEYKTNIDDRARSIERDMNLEQIEESEENYVISISDKAPDNDHSLIHLLTLKKIQDKWVIIKLSIEDGSTPLK
ncbi:nuclear transport factor 2 family protein [Roseivirga sp.]|uniref:nuclear transport factor 2 family protein n=1 Tax=Roseivirga sp. TaxID=1964215 RepID=UPI003B526322